ncbi:YbgC/FadM family acyl-CoA thioesterase [Candidatus Magnetomonas plexicatena]|uniref:YbgC/FadM family acyl-CoA thioesterase n=1 Tax=Candidatus Magnetomonas plexicatena TaxID=2552947 RepID=UPI001C79A007|nr:YbgC/FadM family acyl-CoA thioesterase [Nitrospirales bacterium LBB_01]
MDDRIDIRVYYEDTDCGGVVYYGKYLAFLERARTQYLENRGIKISELMLEGVWFVVADVHIRYHKPAKYADIITVHTEIAELSFASILFKHRIEHKETEALIATAEVKLATVGNDLRPKRMTEKMSKALKVI